MSVTRSGLAFLCTSGVLSLWPDVSSARRSVIWRIALLESETGDATQRFENAVHKEFGALSLSGFCSDFEHGLPVVSPGLIARLRHQADTDQAR